MRISQETKMLGDHELVLRNARAEDALMLLK